jgi:preprotein translocase subunit SecG
MEVVKIIVTILEVIFSVGLIAVVLMQSGKESGLSGAISGSADTYMGKGKSSSLDQKLASWTKWIALVWIALTLTLSLI